MPKRVIALIIVIFPFYVFSQQKKLNQLLSKWEKYLPVEQQKPDTSTINLLNAIAQEYLHTASDSTLIFANKALVLSENLKYAKGRSIAYASIARIHYIKGNYDLSLKYVLISLNINTQNNDKDGVANASNLLGLIYVAEKKTNLALKELYKAVAINKSLANQRRLAANYINISLCYFEDKKPDSAAHYLLLSKAISFKINDQHMIAMANNHLGDYYLEKGQINKAIFYYLSIIKNRNYQNDWENSFAYTGLSKCYYKQGKFKDAVKNSEKGLLLAKKSSTKWDILQALKVLHQSYNALGNAGKAYDYLLLDKSYSDSLFNESKEKEINVLHLKQKQAENEVLLKQNQIAKEKEAFNRMIIFIIILIALFLIVITIIIFRGATKTKRLYQNLQKKSDFITSQKQLIEQKNIELLQSNETKDRLFSIVGHDLRSPFATMLGALELFKTGVLDEDEKQMMLDRIFEQMTVTSAMLDNLLSWANSQREGMKTQITDVPLTTIISEILDVSITAANEKNIKIIHHNEEPILIKADSDQIRIIFRNLITNAIKFTRPNGEIIISYLFEKDVVKVSVKDNGIGMAEDKLKLIFQESGKSISTYGTVKEKGIGIGLMLVKKFIELNNATISVNSKEKEGTEFVVAFNRVNA